jgi:three-Cys-motif partner protein
VPHKADQSFFDSKKEWSKRKDLILSYYLTPYLAKVNSLRQAILIVDGFAGAGMYRSGERGSPVIVAQAIQTLLQKPNHVSAQLFCVEEDDQLRARLTTALSSFPFVEIRPKTFLQNLEEIEKLAATRTTFLYLDPYAIEGLEWSALERVFEYLRGRRSVEILLNFSATAFVRRALAALAMGPPAGDDDDAESESDGSGDAPSTVRLDSVVNGGWWRTIVAGGGPFAEMVARVTAGFCDQLRTHFAEVCEHPIRARWDDVVPKYSLVFASRSSEALILMNEATIKSRDVLARQAKPAHGTLFETRPETLVPDLTKLPTAILQVLTRRMTRRELTAEVVRRNFCMFTESQIRAEVTSLLKAARLRSATGKNRINDDVEVWQPTR